MDLPRSVFVRSDILFISSVITTMETEQLKDLDLLLSDPVDLCGKEMGGTREQADTARS